MLVLTLKKMGVNKILAIAINEYDDFELNKINNCLNDLNAIVSILKSKYLFDDIELLSNKEQTTRKFIYNRLYEYFIHSLEHENILLIYIGHGNYNEAINASYWLPSDSNPTDQSSWFNLNDLLMFLRASKAFHISIISDSCFSGGIFEAAKRGGGIQAFSKKKSRLALTSGGVEPVSDGIKGSLSPFAITLCQVLTENSSKDFPFLSLATEVITKFNANRSQTPMFGALANAGHEGGALIFRLKDKEIDGFAFTEASLALNMNFPINIEYECNIPFFLESKFFDNIFINTFVQHLAYNIISETRSFLNDDKNYYIEKNKELIFYLNISYSIMTLNQKQLSMSINVERHLGNMRTYINIHSLNIAFKPDRRIDLYDLIEFTDFEKFMKSMITKYSDNEDHQKTLLHHLEYFDPHTLDFSIKLDTLDLYFLKYLPSSKRNSAFLSIPINDLHFKI